MLRGCDILEVRDAVEADSDSELPILKKSLEA